MIFGRIWRLFGGNQAATRDVLGNVVVGDVNGILVQAISTGPSQVPLSLPWREPASGSEVLDIFNLLTWRSRLSQNLIGRDDAFARLLSWAREDSRPIAIRLLTGPGGAGKSRLAAEVMETLRQEGWSTGLIALDKTSALPIVKSGLFLAVDYPEMNREAVSAVLRAAGNMESPPSRIRLLLISRQPMRWWQDDVIAARASELCDAQEVVLGPLPVNLAVNLVQQVVRRLSILKEVPMPELDLGDVARWHARDPDLHGLPLISTAAAVHAMINPSATFSLAGAHIIEALVARERMRLDVAGKGAGWADQAGARLHGLAALREGLDEEALKRLARAAPDIGLPSPKRVADDVQKLGWWSNGQLRAPQPDLVATELLYQILFSRSQAAPEWISVTLADLSVVDVERLNRLMHDLATFRPSAPEIFVEWMKEAIARDPKRARSWIVLVSELQTGFRLAPVAVTVARIILQEPDLAKPQRAWLLLSLSYYLYEAGEREEALNPARMSVEIFRGLALEDPVRFDAGLARSLYTLSIRMAECGENSAALDPAQESVAIYRRLAQADPTRFQPQLARGLNILSNRLGEVGKDSVALATIQEAVEIRRRLTQEDPARYEHELAQSLNNLSIRLAQVGEIAAALEMIEEVVEIRRHLAQVNPSLFEPRLAQGLHNLSLRLAQDGKASAALKASQEAVEIRRRLAQASPARFEPDLGFSLNGLAISLAQTGDAPAALEASQAATEIYRRLAQANPARFEPNLAKTLHNLSRRLNVAGEATAAVEAIQEAAEIHRRLAEADPARFQLNLLRSLNALATRLAQAGEASAAQQASQEAIECRRRLAEARGLNRPETG